LFLIPLCGPLYEGFIGYISINKQRYKDSVKELEDGQITLAYDFVLLDFKPRN